MKFASFLILAILITSVSGTYVSAQSCPTGTYIPDYYSTENNGNWTTNSDWNTGLPKPLGAPPSSWYTPATPPSTLPTVTIPAGVILKIESPNFDLTGYNLVVAGTLVINGKLGLSTGSYVELKAGAILCCEGNNCNSNSDQLKIGTSTIWNGSNGPISGPAISNGGPLPVELLFFRAVPRKATIVLEWATATERNAAFFAIERSLNGKQFEEIGRLDAAGNSIFRKDYSFTDEEAFLGRSYYRLKQVDFDGAFEYFNITFADLDGSRKATIYPNPIENQVLQLKLNYASEDEVSVRIFNSNGILVGGFTFHGSSHNKQTDLRPGAYVAKVQVGGETYTQRFIVP